MPVKAANSVEWKMNNSQPERAKKKTTRELFAVRIKLNFMVLFGCHHVCIKRSARNTATTRRVDLNTESGWRAKKIQQQKCTWINTIDRASGRAPVHVCATEICLSICNACSTLYAKRNQFHPHPNPEVCGTGHATERHIVSPPIESQHTQTINHKQNYTRADACMHLIFNRMRRRPFFTHLSECTCTCAIFARIQPTGPTIANRIALDSTDDYSYDGHIFAFALHAIYAPNIICPSTFCSWLNLYWDCK